MTDRPDEPVPGEPGFGEEKNREDQERAGEGTTAESGVSGWRPATPPQATPLSEAPTPVVGGSVTRGGVGGPGSPGPGTPSAGPGYGFGAPPPSGPQGYGQPGYGPPPGMPQGPPPPGYGYGGWYPRGPAQPPPPSGAYSGPGAPGPGYGPPPPGYGPYGPPPSYPPPMPPGGWRAVPPGSPYRKKMSPIRIALLVGLAIIVLVVVLDIASSFIGSLGAGAVGLGEKIGVLEVEGVIGDGVGYDTRVRELIKTLKDWQEDSGIRGIVVRINSPGGTVGATQELYHQIIEYRIKTKRPVVASMGDIAASGGYYTALACDEIYANPGTLTGSIGVLLRFLNYEVLSDKVGLEFTVVKSGEFKDIGSGSRPMTEAERQLLKEMVDDVQNQFEKAVTDGRAAAVRAILSERTGKTASDIAQEELDGYIRQYSDGRIFSGSQAAEFGMVDELGPMESAITRVKTLAKIKGEPKLVTSRRPRGFLEALSGETQSLIGKIKPGDVSLEYRFALP